MAQFEVIMPKMGESIEEATITKWFVKVGDNVQEDDVLLEIATDKVDSEIPSPVEGVVSKILYQQDEVVAVGSVIALINLDGEEVSDSQEEDTSESQKEDNKASETMEETQKSESSQPPSESSAPLKASSGSRFYSPLVRKIAAEENVSQEILDTIPGSGQNGRVQKRDILKWLETRGAEKQADAQVTEPVATEKTEQKTVESPEPSKVQTSVSAGDEIVKMDRMRKLIADHMVNSVKVSAHVTNMIEADVTRIVNWRNSVKDQFQKREGVKITFLPLFLEAAVKALKDYPMINSSVDGENIIIKKNINLGIAVALPDNNLIVPVIKNADQLNLTGLTKELNRLAANARASKLSPEDIQNGTFTVTNFGSFGNTIGTPIINQPQVAILAVGAIEKKPAVVETPEGDVIAIRHKMFLSLTYDHRIIDGSLGGSFLKRVAENIENFDPNRTI
jgi:2-oxoglutarate dehydrogenase E2 component (dihydrolipoamide succinyltransferase)